MFLRSPRGRLNTAIKEFLFEDEELKETLSLGSGVISVEEEEVDGVNEESPAEEQVKKEETTMSSYDDDDDRVPKSSVKYRTNPGTHKEWQDWETELYTVDWLKQVVQTSSLGLRTSLSTMRIWMHQASRPHRSCC